MALRSRGLLLLLRKVDVGPGPKAPSIVGSLIIVEQADGNPTFGLFTFLFYFYFLNFLKKFNLILFSILNLCFDFRDCGKQVYLGQYIIFI